VVAVLEHEIEPRTLVDERVEDVRERAVHGGDVWGQAEVGERPTGDPAPPSLRLDGHEFAAAFASSPARTSLATSSPEPGGRLLAGSEDPLGSSSSAV
jgi:hypothetical protein